MKDDKTRLQAINKELDPIIEQLKELIGKNKDVNFGFILIFSRSN